MKIKGYNDNYDFGVCRQLPDRTIQIAKYIDKKNMTKQQMVTTIANEMVMREKRYKEKEKSKKYDFYFNVIIILAIIISAIANVIIAPNTDSIEIHNTIDIISIWIVPLIIFIAVIVRNATRPEDDDNQKPRYIKTKKIENEL